MSQKYSLGKILNLQKYTGIHINTLDLRVIQSKKYYRIHVNTQEYITMHVNIQENNGFLRITVWGKLLNLQEYTLDILEFSQ